MHQALLLAAAAIAHAHDAWVTGPGVPDQLAAAREAAREQRLATNRAARCAVCAPA